MSGTNPSQIRVAGHGHVFVAPLGTTAPADCTTAWGAAWHDLGYTDTSGVKFTKKDKLDKVESWQAATPVRHVFSARDLTLKFTLLQVNSDTLPFFMGGSAISNIGTGTPPAPLWQYNLATTPDLDERMLGIEFTDTIQGTGGGSVKYRIIVNRGAVTDTDDISLVNNGAVKLGVTFEAMEVNDTTPLATWLMNDPAMA
jgi:hypothetical protein